MAAKLTHKQRIALASILHRYDFHPADHQQLRDLDFCAGIFIHLLYEDGVSKRVCHDHRRLRGLARTVTIIR